jgi:hypothetical protein
MGGSTLGELRWEPSPEMMDELYHYMQSEPAAYEAKEDHHESPDTPTAPLPVGLTAPL